MEIIPPKAPQTFSAAQRKRALEAQKAMSMALKEHRFEDALENARTALALDPNNIMIKEFVRLLEEKAELDVTDDDSEGEGGAAPAAGAAGAPAAGSDDESEDEDEEDEGETTEESSEDDEESEEEDAAVLKALGRLRMDGQPEDPDAPRQVLIPAAKRRALRTALAKSVKELLEAELARKMMESDPLLGA